MKILKKVGNVIFYLGLAFAILVMSQNFMMKINKEYIPNIFGYTYFNVLSQSMEPELYPMDLVIAKKVKEAHTINTNDVIVFKDPDGTLICHRVKSITDNGYVTKGDNNKFEDEAIINKSDIVAIKTTAIPKIGLIIEKLQEPLMQFVVLGMLLLSITKDIVNEFKGWRKRTDEEKSESLEV